MNKIGFVGLGRMGGNMAARLMDAGHELYGTARNRAHVQPLIDQGLVWLDTARDVAEEVDVLFTSLPDDDALLAVASGPDGVIAGLAPGKVWVDTSTVSPMAARGLARRVREHGAALLASPVSGSVPQVQSGSLTIIVGGPRDAFAQIESILWELGTPYYVGDNGQALILKLAINVSLAVQTLAFAEGYLLALRSGVDADVARDLMTSSAIASPALKARAPLMLDPPEEAWFDIGFMQKDIELALEAAREFQVPLPSAGRADEVLTIAQEFGYEHSDIAALLLVLRRMTAADGLAA
jgi:3-hydroxyisobutyrate dehydrogenase-like beta-hydroxyacid dehydrogenase